MLSFHFLLLAWIHLILYPFNLKLKFNVCMCMKTSWTYNILVYTCINCHSIFKYCCLKILHKMLKKKRGTFHFNGLFYKDDGNLEWAAKSFKWNNMWSKWNNWFMHEDTYKQHLKEVWKKIMYQVIMTVHHAELTHVILFRSKLMVTRSLGHIHLG